MNAKQQQLKKAIESAIDVVRDKEDMTDDMVEAVLTSVMQDMDGHEGEG